METTLVVGIGDIHGRFIRVNDWIGTLEAALGRSADLVLAVGDIEAFPSADEHMRKAARRTTAAEFADFVDGRQKLRRPMYFIGGNNEDFATLHALPGGGKIAPDVHYLGRGGAVTLAGLRVGFLSGIHAPRYFDAPLEMPKTPESAKRAGYFRAPDLAAVQRERDIDLLLVHEWPRGVVSRKGAEGRGIHRALRAYRFPWIGNPVTRALVNGVEPRWVWCGHSHVPFAGQLEHPDGRTTRVACLDQAAKPEGAVFWLEFDGTAPIRAGWGIDGKVAWRHGERWDESVTPTDEDSDSATRIPSR